MTERIYLWGLQGRLDPLEGELFGRGETGRRSSPVLAISIMGAVCSGGRRDG